MGEPGGDFPSGGVNGREEEEEESLEVSDGRCGSSVLNEADTQLSYARYIER